MSKTDTAIFEEGLKNSFKKIKEELEDHLTAINENTEEITELYDFLADIEAKMDKLNEKLEEVHMILSKLQIPVDASLKIKPLTINERQIFLALYSSEKPLSYAELAKQLNYSETLTTTYVQNLIEKKIPVIALYKDGLAYFSIDKDFKELQAKSNVIGLDQKSLKEKY
jgi:DNA-binding transcriptional regulator GbsR (MarR family)